LDFAVHKLLRNADTGTSVALVVFGGQFKLERLACDDHFFGVQFFNGHANTVLVVLAGKGVRTRERAAVANGDDLFVRLGVASESECDKYGGTGNGKFHQESLQ